MFEKYVAEAAGYPSDQVTMSKSENDAYIDSDTKIIWTDNAIRKRYSGIYNDM